MATKKKTASSGGGTRTKRSFIRWIDRRLAKEHGEKGPPEERTDPLDELILTVLSQNTNDVNRDRAYEKMRKRFPKWKDVMEADVKELEESIRVGGLAGQKSERIKKMLADIVEKEGKLSLDSVCDLSVEEGLEYLKSFKGVGDKTAAIVMLFSCGKPVFPVDTHIHRLSKRLGLVPEKADAEKAHKILGKEVPEDIMYGFHINLIEHGRKICKARKPDCPSCTLNNKCPSAFKV